MERLFQSQNPQSTGYVNDSDCNEPYTKRELSFLEEIQSLRNDNNALKLEKIQLQNQIGDHEFYIENKNQELIEVLEVEKKCNKRIKQVENYINELEDQLSQQKQHNQQLFSNCQILDTEISFKQQTNDEIEQKLKEQTKSIIRFEDESYNLQDHIINFLQHIQSFLTEITNKEQYQLDELCKQLQEEKITISDSIQQTIELFSGNIVNQIKNVLQDQQKQISTLQNDNVEISQQFIQLQNQIEISNNQKLEELQQQKEKEQKEQEQKQKLQYVQQDKPSVKKQLEYDDFKKDYFSSPQTEKKESVWKKYWTIEKKLRVSKIDDSKKQDTIKKSLGKVFLTVNKFTSGSGKGGTIINKNNLKEISKSHQLVRRNSYQDIGKVRQLINKDRLKQFGTRRVLKR